MTIAMDRLRPPQGKPQPTPEKESMSKRFLLNPRNNRVLAWSPALAKKEGFVECDARGTLLYALPTTPREERRVTRWLGNPKNKRLLPYSPALAKRPEFVSIDTPEEWQAMLAKKEAAETQGEQL